MPSADYDEELIKKIAIAMTENPRYTIKELAEVSGISKATLHRICGTRENLENILLQRANDTVQFIINTARKDYEDYTNGLKALIDAHYKDYEIFRWVTTLPLSAIEEHCSPDYFVEVEKFFLRGQKQGAFRIDFNVSFLTNVFMSGICGLIDAERRGRVARVGIAEAFEDFFLHGIRQ